MKASVIIVNYNTRELLSRCLRSVHINTASSFEILVIDNHSTDGSTVCVRTDFPDVHVIESEVNLGFSKANNTAAKASRGDYLVFLNSDTEIRERTIDELVAFLDAHPNVGIASPRLVYPDGRFQLSAGAFPNLLQEFKDRRLYRRVNAGDETLRARIAAQFDRPREVGWVTGACLAIRRGLYNTLGGFDENIFMYFEDKDLCKRAQSLGWKIMVVPTAEIVHVLNGSLSDGRIRLRKIYRESQKVYYRKHLGPLSLFLLKLYHTFST